MIIAILSLATAEAEPLRIVAFGDSLTSGYRLPPEASFPAKLQAALKARGYDVTVANAGAPGNTATSGLERLDRSVPQGTDGVIVEFGANDALRGIDVHLTERALDAIIARLKARGIPVLLAGMWAPSSRGVLFMADFHAIYPRLAEKHAVALYPFFLAGVAANPSLNLRDGIHPNAAGVDVIVSRIMPTVEIWLDGMRASRSVRERASP
ncbi:arylesterase [Ancylobacter sp. Lp-2]|nr:arylesterase [Ancylobacter sp. Lp-2]MCB4770496.1 arylesterase [Ancylobacter sp. Lp-2]